MPKKIDDELKARAVRLVNDHQGEYSSLTAAAAVVAKQLAVLRYAFEELGLTKVYVLFHPDNHRSARVAAKLGALPLPPLRAPDQSEVRRVHVVDRETFANRG